MSVTGKGQDLDPGERRAVVLEFIAASAIFGIVLVVLYMIFSYRPI